MNNQTNKSYMAVIVDDDPGLVEYLTDLLEEEYPNRLIIISFNCPKEAYEFVQKSDVSLLISDMRMPGIHGDNFLNMCIELNKGIKTISMTGYPGLGTVMSRFRNGDIGYLVKPFDNKDLCRLIDLALKSLDSWEPILSKSA